MGKKKKCLCIVALQAMVPLFEKTYVHASLLCNKSINPFISGRLSIWCKKPTHVSVHRTGACGVPQLLPVEQGIRIEVEVLTWEH